jgi:hypothetical protein
LLMKMLGMVMSGLCILMPKMMIYMFLRCRARVELE